MDSPKKLSPFESALSRRKLLQGGAAAAAAGLAAPLLAACGSSSPSKASSGSSSNGKTQLTLMSWEMFEPAETKAWHKVVDNFMAAHPSIEVKWTGWPFANYDQNVIAQAQAGHVDADVVMCPPELGSTLIQDYNLCEPIGDIAQSVGLVPNAAHEQFVVDGKLYLLGVLEVAFLLAYNQAMLKDGGFEGVFISADGTKDPQFVSQAGEAAKGAILSCPCGPATGPFADEYKKKFNADAGTYSAEGYDLGTILVKGIDSGAITRPALLDFVRNYNGQGVARKYQWTPTGELTTNLIWIFKVQ